MLIKLNAEQIKKYKPNTDKQVDYSWTARRKGTLGKMGEVMKKSAVFAAFAVLSVLVNVIHGCYCPPSDFRTHFCGSPFAIKGFLQSEEAISSSYGRIYTRYTVNVEKVYRKPADETIGDTLVISVPYQSSMCGMLLTTGQDYFITGWFYPGDNEKYHVNGCELTTYYSSLTEAQKAGIDGGYGCNN
ncbi:uncharacterized protein [Argopecten irradians]|uniref:uncharacterized protein isoform X2 n=1 Tax=Argopecten irradians TaxID=31199 RepID=UPI003714B218